MKKFWLLLLSTLICISVSGCGQSDATKAADALISSIGVVSLDSAEAIASAEAAVNALTEKERESLRNWKALEQARIDYNAVLVSNAISIIDDIGTVSVNSGEHISVARNTYNQLLPELKTQVENYSDLTTAEERYDLLQKELHRIEESISAIGKVSLYSKEKIEAARYRFNSADEITQASVANTDTLIEAEKIFSGLCVDNVISLIKMIGTVTLDSEEIIITARNAYDELSAQEQTLVENYHILSSAEDAIAQLKDTEKKNRYADALNSLHTEYDKVEDTTWYISDYQPQYTNTRNFIFPYIGQKEQSVWLRLKFNYTGDDWLFFESVTIWVDGEQYRIDFDYSSINRDNKYGDVWEVADIAPSENNINMLWSIVNSEETIIRFESDHKHYDFTMRDSDKTGIEDVLVVYSQMIEN